MTVLNINTTQEFNELLNNNRKVVVDMWAAWCGPCRQYGPNFEKVSESNNSHTFAKVNVDEISEIAKRYRVTTIPTTLVFSDGNIVDRLTGVLTPNQLSDALTAVA